MEVGWKMINLSVTDRAGQSGSRERGADRKVERSVRGTLRSIRGLRRIFWVHKRDRKDLRDP